MTRAFVKGIVMASAALGLVLSTAGVAFPARTGPRAQDARKAVRVVAFYNQSVLVAQGLTPKAAIDRARRFAPYPLSTAHYIPKGFQLAIVEVYPYIPNTREPQDTLIFMKLMTGRASSAKAAQPAAAFELDHQFGQPYSYLGPFTTETVTLGRHHVSVAEEKYRDFRTHRAIDLLNVYWFDTRTKVATEVTSDLATSHLTRAEILRVAASVS